MAGVEASFNSEDPGLSLPCGLSIKIPRFSIAFILPTIPFPPTIPIPFFGFALSCDPLSPINMTAGLDYGGGRVARFDANPDATDT